MCFWKLFRVKGRGETSYPREILPTAKYVIKIDIDDLLSKLGDFIICRRIEGSLEENTVIFNGKPRIKVESLGKIPNLSTNLLGGKFNAEKHIAFSPTGDARLDWDGNDVEFAIYKDSFKIIENCTYVAYHGNNLHDIPIPYKKNLSKDDRNKLAGLGINLDNLVSQDEAVLQGTIKLEHKPTMLNYWHIVMDLYPYDSSSPIKKDNSAWQRNLIDFVVQKLLTVKFDTSPAHIPSIPKKSFIKTKN